MSYEVIQAQQEISRYDVLAAEPNQIWCAICQRQKESYSALVVFSKERSKESGLYLNVCDDHSKEEAQGLADDMTREAILNQDSDTYEVTDINKIDQL